MRQSKLAKKYRTEEIKKRSNIWSPLLKLDVYSSPLPDPSSSLDLHADIIRKNPTPFQVMKIKVIKILQLQTNSKNFKEIQIICSHRNSRPFIRAIVARMWLFFSKIKRFPYLFDIYILPWFAIFLSTFAFFWKSDTLAFMR